MSALKPQIDWPVSHHLPKDLIETYKPFAMQGNKQHSGRFPLHKLMLTSCLVG